MDLPEASRQYQNALEAHRVLDDEDTAQHLRQARRVLELAWLDSSAETASPSEWGPLGFGT